MRIANRHGLAPQEQRRVVELAHEIDRIIGDRVEKFRLNEQELKLVERYAAQGWSLIGKAIISRHDCRPNSAKSGTPTNKIFCIGFHKTGTSSMAHALKALGYRVTGQVGTMDPRINENALGMALRLATKFDAFHGNPWSVLYRQMDEAFPGSKFILTKRPADKWISSAIKHFGAKETPMREWIYGHGHGSPLGNEQVYLSRYDKHINDVIEYFKDRKKDLLIMDFEAGDGWETICKFLEKSVPDEPFPHRNRAIDREVK